MKKDIVLEEFQETLPFHFKDLVLLQKVFVHRSFLNEKDASTLKAKESYERLEFLGDAVLSNIVSHLLYDKYPDADEGELTRLRAKLVNRQALANIARGLNLNDYVLLGKGERSGGGSENPMILAGVFEALVAAIYFELGFKITFSYMEMLFSPLIDTATAHEPGHFDYKPRLQELSQRIFKEAPAYRLVKEEGPPHKKTFDLEVVIKGEVFGRGSAAKKKDAEQLAAEEALKKLEAREKEGI
ncbi:MAG: ribonuclease III [Deltaproteobacteria bacterium]|nr:ribonuclease III [Deltaproteobacteria bacterium]